jgi:hypothetical protein
MKFRFLAIPEDPELLADGQIGIGGGHAFPGSQEIGREAASVGEEDWVANQSIREKVRFFDIQIAISGHGEAFPLQTMQLRLAKLQFALRKQEKKVKHLPERRHWCGSFPNWRHLWPQPCLK